MSSAGPAEVAAPRVADDISLPELTLRGLVLGALITVVFTASNIYLGLKIGLTFSSSIPAAVIAMAVLGLARGSNSSRTTWYKRWPRAGGTLSAVIFILPGLIMIGHWHGFPFWQSAGVCAWRHPRRALSAPLRRALVVQSNLPYPEGVAAAAILRWAATSRERRPTRA